MNAARVANIFKGVGVEQYEVRRSSNRHGTCIGVQELGDVGCTGLKRLEWCQAGSDEKLEFVVQRKPGDVEYLRRIGAKQDSPRCFMQRQY